jgi:hypothetical protein
MATPQFAICLDDVGLGATRATLRGCYHQFCTRCILQDVLDHSRTKGPQCQTDIGAVHWAGNTLEVPSVPQPAPAAVDDDLGPNVYFSAQGTLVHVERTAMDMTIDSAASHFGVATQQIINMNTTQRRQADERPWPMTARGSTVLDAGTDVWLWFEV